MALQQFHNDPFYWPAWWLHAKRPSRIFDQHFGSGLFDHDQPMPFYARPRRSKETGVSEVKNNTEKFEVRLDVQHFTPEELTVKTVDKFIVIEGKHEERNDEHGFIKRAFVRKYLLPDDVRVDTVNCSMSSDGVLSVTAPKIPQDTKTERPIQIEMKEAPAIPKGNSNPGSQQTEQPNGKETNIPVNNE